MIMLDKEYLCDINYKIINEIEVCLADDIAYRVAAV